MRYAFTLLMASLMIASLSVAEVALAQDTAPTLKPYVARYNVKYRGLSGGDIEFTLSSDGAGKYVFTSHVLPNFLGSLFASDQMQDRSELTFDGQQLRPMQFRADDGTKDTYKDQRYDFDWNTHQAKGVFRDREFTLALPDGVQDRLTIQLAASLALQAGREPGKLVMLERDELQEFHITRQGQEQVHTAAGDFNTVVLKSERDGSTRVTRYWYAGKLNFIPVRAERLTKGKVDIVMELKSYKAL